jgi:hypothetical protein
LEKVADIKLSRLRPSLRGLDEGVEILPKLPYELDEPPIEPLARCLFLRGGIAIALLEVAEDDMMYIMEWIRR